MLGRSEVEVAQLFRGRRKDLGLTQAEAAARAGVSTPTWIRMESGGRCTPATRRAVALALGWAIDAHARLLTGDDPATLGEATANALPPAEGIEQITAILHRMDLSPDRIDIILNVIEGLLAK